MPEHKNEYNAVYNTFVDEESDLVGMIAYSFYKGEKLKLVAKLHEEGKSEEQKKEVLEKFSQDAISKKEEYFDKAFNVAEGFANYLFKDVVNDEYRATLLAENRANAKWVHLGLTVVWGAGIIIGFVYLGKYLNDIKESSLYKPGISFKDSNEILFYLFERFARRLFVVGAIFYGIRILWYNFKLSFHSFIMNIHQSDNLKVFDYVKNESEDKDGIMKELLKYVFVENHDKDSSSSTKSADSQLGHKLLNKITEKIDNIFDSASKIVTKEEGK